LPMDFVNASTSIAAKSDSLYLLALLNGCRSAILSINGRRGTAGNCIRRKLPGTFDASH